MGSSLSRILYPDENVEDPGSVNSSLDMDGGELWDPDPVEKVMGASPSVSHVMDSMQSDNAIDDHTTERGDTPIMDQVHTESMKVNGQHVGSIDATGTAYQPSHVMVSSDNLSTELFDARQLSMSRMIQTPEHDNIDVNQCYDRCDESFDLSHLYAQTYLEQNIENVPEHESKTSLGKEDSRYSEESEGIPALQLGSCTDMLRSEEIDRPLEFENCEYVPKIDKIIQEKDGLDHDLDVEGRQNLQLSKFLEKRKMLTNFELLRQKREVMTKLERQKRDGYSGPVKYKCKNSHTGLFSFFVVPIILSDIMIDFMTMIMVDIMVDIMISTAAPGTGGGNNNNNNNNNNNRGFKQTNIIANIINTIADTFIPNNGDEDYSDAWMENIETARVRRDAPIMDFSQLYLNRKSLEFSTLILNPEKGLNQSRDGSLELLKPKMEQFLVHYRDHVSKKKVHSRRKINPTTNDTLYIDENEISVLQRASHNPSVVIDIIKGLYKEYLRKKEECRSEDDSLCRVLFCCEKS